MTDMFYELFHSLNTKYGVRVKTCSLCTFVWTYCSLSRIGELSKFYWYLVTRFPTCTEYEPELFPCITINFCKVSIRMFHISKINLLGVQQVKQVSEIVEFLLAAYFDYSLSCNLDNLCIHVFIFSVSFLT